MSAGATRTGDPPSAALEARLGGLLDRRLSAGRSFFAAEAERLARCCADVAERFRGGGRLLAVGGSPTAQSDARHVAVEFAHPVIVGKRALPALAVGVGGAGPVGEIELLAEAPDVVIGFGVGEDGAGVARALELARSRGCLTIAFAPGPAQWEFLAPGDDPYVRQELVETLYHLLWELVHVFFERGLTRPGESQPPPASASFLYPFLSGRGGDREAVIADVRRSVIAKAEEAGELRRQTLTDGRQALIAAAAALRRAFGAGRRLLAFGNGGSATDAMDLVADLGPEAPFTAPALDLCADPAILTAIANDVGPEELFSRQLIAYGRPGDVAVALTTSGGSPNIIRALGEARARGLATVAFVGYDGGPIAARGLADHVIVSRSEHIPRIQEAQASGYHAMLELLAPAPAR
jgi:D-sedoheptulose 7-phosphate isomerase